MALRKFFTLVQISKKRFQITLRALSTKVIQGRDLEPFIKDLSQRGNFFEIKLPLVAILSTILDLKTFKKREADLLIIFRSAIFSIGSTINVSKYQAIVCLFL